MIINLTQATRLIKLIDKMGLREEIIQTMIKIDECNLKNKALLRELYKQIPPGTEINNELTEKLFKQNRNIEEQLRVLHENMAKISFNFMFLVAENISKAENEFYKTIAQICNVKESKLRIMGIDELMAHVREIYSSESFKKLLL